MKSRMKKAEESRAQLEQELLNVRAAKLTSAPLAGSSSFRAPPPEPTIHLAGVRMPTRTLPPPGLQQQPPRQSGLGGYGNFDSPRQTNRDSCRPAVEPCRTAVDSSEESEEEKFTRHRTSVKTIELAQPPAVGGLRTWLSEFYMKACSASNRSTKRTMDYLALISSVADIVPLEVVSKC